MGCGGGSVEQDQVDIGVGSSTDPRRRATPDPCGWAMDPNRWMDSSDLDQDLSDLDTETHTP